MGKESPSEKEGSVLSLIQQLKDKKRAAVSLSIEERRRCVEYFWVSEAQTDYWMAEVLDCSEKTIRRDKQVLQEQISHKLGKDFTNKFLGLMIARSLNHEDHLIRIANGKNTPEAEKIKARYLAFKIQAELFEKIRSLGIFAFQNQLDKDGPNKKALVINVMPVPGRIGEGDSNEQSAPTA